LSALIYPLQRALARTFHGRRFRATAVAVPSMLARPNDNILWQSVAEGNLSAWCIENGQMMRHLGRLKAGLGSDRSTDTAGENHSVRRSTLWRLGACNKCKLVTCMHGPQQQSRHIGSLVDVLTPKTGNAAHYRAPLMPFWLLLGKGVVPDTSMTQHLEGLCPVACTAAHAGGQACPHPQLESAQNLRQEHVCV
jgi:hypothetical protein